VEGIDGVKREMTDERYKNRLTEYVRNNVEGKRQRQTVVRIVGDLYSRLNALDGLASKGVHDEVTQAEAETCVVWTYMLAGDIVRMPMGHLPCSPEPTTNRQLTFAACKVAGAGQPVYVAQAGPDVPGGRYGSGLVAGAGGLLLGRVGLRDWDEYGDFSRRRVGVRLIRSQYVHDG
jgi:hypothetical protein